MFHVTDCLLLEQNDFTPDSLNKMEVDSVKTNAEHIKEETNDKPQKEQHPFHNVCRLCAKSSKNLVTIFGECATTKLSQKLRALFVRYAPVDVCAEEDNTLPNQCCYSCASVLTLWNKSCLDMVRAQTLFRQQTDEMDKLTNKVESGKMLRYTFQSYYNTFESILTNMLPETIESQAKQTETKTRKPMIKRGEHKRKLWACRLLPKSDATRTKRVVFRSNALKPTNKFNRFYTCNHCTQIFNSRFSLLRHQNSVKNVQTNKCTSCGKQFASTEKFKAHLQLHSKPQTGGLRCDECNITYELRITYEQHMRAHEKYKYKCPHCSQVFNTERLLNMHVTSSHNNNFKCASCTMTFSKEEDLKHHSFVHTGKKPYTCEICARGFMQVYNLKVHMKTIHNPDRPRATTAKCQYCGKQMASASEVRVHKLRAHANTIATMTDGTTEVGKGDALVQCPHCSLWFENFTILTRHINRGHTHSRPIKCDTCGQQFTSSTELRRHLITHRSTRPIESTATSTTTWVSTSTSTSWSDPNVAVVFCDELPDPKILYRCGVCNKGFATESRLAVHFARHDHEEGDVDIE